MSDTPLTDEEALRLLENMAQAEEEFMYPEQQLGCDPVTFFNGIKADIRYFVIPMAKFVDNTAIGTGVTKVVGGSLGIIGGGLTVVGIAAAPFTLGVSLVLTCTGLGISIGGTATASGATITKFALDKKKKRQSKEAFDKICEKINNFVDIIKKYEKAFQAGYEYFSSETGKQHLWKWIKSGFKYLKMASCTVSIAFTVSKIVSVAVTTLRLLEVAELSTDVAQISIKAIWSEIKIGGRVLATAGSKTAVIVASAGAALSIGFGIWDCVSGAKDIKIGWKSKKGAREGGRENLTNGVENEDGRRSSEVVSLLATREDNKNTGKEDNADCKQQVKELAEEIRGKATEMEGLIDTILTAYLEKREDLEAQNRNATRHAESLLYPIRTESLFGVQVLN